MRFFSPYHIFFSAILTLLQLFVPGSIEAKYNSGEQDQLLIEIRELIHQADSLVQIRQLDSAIDLANQALEKSEMVIGDNDTTVAIVLNILGVCYRNQSEYSKAEHHFKKALEIREKKLGSDHPDVANSLNNLAILYSMQDKYSEAEQHHRQALSIREKKLGIDHIEVANSLGNIAIDYWKQGRYLEAEPLLKRSLSIYEKVQLPDHPKLASVLGNLANLYSVQGRYSEAEPIYKRSLSIIEKIVGENHPYVARGLHNMASLYAEQGRYSESELFFKRALDIKEKTLRPDHPDIASTLNNLANLNTLQGRYAEAEPLFKRALAIRESSLESDHLDIAYSLEGLASLYYEKGKTNNVEPLLERALKIREKTQGPDHELIATDLNSLASLYRDQEKYSEAESLYKRALEIREKALGFDHPKTSESLRNLARNYCSLDNFKEALNTYHRQLESNQNFIDYIFSSTSEEQKLRYLEKYPMIDHSFLSFAMKYHSEKARRYAFEMILGGKAAVIDAVSAEKEIAFCTFDEEIIATFKRHTEVSGEIAIISLAGPEKIGSDLYSERLRALYETRDSLEIDLSLRCAEFKNKLESRIFRVPDIVNLLPDRSVLWEFVKYDPYEFQMIGNEKERTGSPRYIAFTLNHTGTITLTDLGYAVEIDSLVSLARKLIYDARSVAYSQIMVESEKELSEVTGELYRKIFSPIASNLDEGSNIFISPDGLLNLLPFEILLSPNNEYVIEKYRISYLSSGRDLLRFQKKQKKSDWALVMADPEFDYSGEISIIHEDETLQGAEISVSLFDIKTRSVNECLRDPFPPLPITRKETRSVTRTLKKKARLTISAYYGTDANERVLKEISTAPRVLHLSTHGYFCEDLDISQNQILENPLLRSGLALAGANQLMEDSGENLHLEDGILTAFEVSGLNLMGTEHATLSACETGLGEVKNGEGVFGLRRAFQSAGAESILMSLWKVPDEETYQLMDRFYKNWLDDGMTKREALRQSSLRILNSLRKKNGTAHPLFWGGFVLVGNPN
jgi:CHAT domain-containing protein/tetratricopeptide (TPR) repeat protein